MDSPTNTGAGVVKMTICLAGCEETIFQLRDIPKVLLGTTYSDLNFNVIKYKRCKQCKQLIELSILNLF